MSQTPPVTATVARLAARLAAEHTVLAATWLRRLEDVVDAETREIFPSHTLLDHIPELIRQIAAYLAAPADEEIKANTAVLAKATELGLLRYDQRASVHQLLREYQILGEVLEEFFAREVARRADRGDSGDAVAAVLAVGRANQAVRVLQQHTVDAFIARYTAAIDRQTAQLRGFSRIVSHEIRQPLDVLRTLSRVLPGLTADTEVAGLAGTLERNVVRLAEVAGKLEWLSRLARTSEVALNEQSVPLTPLVTDVARQLTEMAAARGVRIEVAADLPVLTTDSGRAELVFVNLLANAIKYSDPGKSERVVRIAADRSVAHPRVVVHDNGIGIPPARLAVIFDQFVRAHAGRDAELGVQGLGLGLAIVRESMDAMGGAVSVASTDGQGTTFALDWPSVAERPPD
ncbi:MAG: sensor histidine kinase [Vicinamibacterales bacterium]